MTAKALVEENEIFPAQVKALTDRLDEVVDGQPGPLVVMALLRCLSFGLACCSLNSDQILQLIGRTLVLIGREHAKRRDEGWLTRAQDEEQEKNKDGSKDRH